MEQKDSASNSTVHALNRVLPFIGLIALIAVGMKVMHWPFSGLLLVLSTTLLSMLLFIQGFAQLTTKGAAPDRFIYMVLHMSLSATSIGFLFTLQHWPMGGLQLLIGLAGSSVGFIYALLVGIKKSPDVFPVRTIVIAGVIVTMGALAFMGVFSERIILQAYSHDTEASLTIMEDSTYYFNDPANYQGLMGQSTWYGDSIVLHTVESDETVICIKRNSVIEARSNGAVEQLHITVYEAGN